MWDFDFVFVMDSFFFEYLEHARQKSELLENLKNYLFFLNFQIHEYETKHQFDQEEIKIFFVDSEYDQFLDLYMIDFCFKNIRKDKDYRWELLEIPQGISIFSLLFHEWLFDYQKEFEGIQEFPVTFLDIHQAKEFHDVLMEDLLEFIEFRFQEIAKGLKKLEPE